MFVGVFVEFIFKVFFDIYKCEGFVGINKGVNVVVVW